MKITTTKLPKLLWGQHRTQNIFIKAYSK